MRCELVASLFHKPKILFLDEPTIGLDVIAKQQVRTVLKQFNEQEGTTIVLTSHDAGDIEMLAKRTVIINHGIIVFDDSTEQLKKRFITTKIIEFILDEPFDVEWPYGTVIEKSPISIKVAVDIQNTAIADVMSFAMSHGKISDINIYDQPLEEIIAAIYRMAKRCTVMKIASYLKQILLRLRAYQAIAYISSLSRTAFLGSLIMNGLLVGLYVWIIKQLYTCYLCSCSIATDRWPNFS